MLHNSVAQHNATPFSDARSCASQYIEIGYSVLPIRTDGSKSPACETWSDVTVDEFTADDVEGHAVAIKCGTTSENLLILDFECAETFQDFREIVAANGLGYVLDAAPIVATPREDSTLIRAPIPQQNGHSFHAKAGRCSRAKWAPCQG